MSTMDALSTTCGESRVKSRELRVAISLIVLIVYYSCVISGSPSPCHIKAVPVHDTVLASTAHCLL